MQEDTEERYRQHLGNLISRTKSRGSGRYFNKYVSKCRYEASIAFPKGAAIARKKDIATGGFIAALIGFFSFFG
jgi:hypothetical protein